mmetsp:Transcript_18557/g.37243  ORF Transcript_18557/g.37243 Transcript_18557/m.37243 type:complete len:142 (+) Transcript_18557:231-656(+)
MLALNHPFQSRKIESGSSADKWRRRLRPRKNRNDNAMVNVIVALIASMLFAPKAEAKICVETKEDVFLCTDDMAKARLEAMRRKDDEPVRFAKHLDLGVEQRNDGKPHEQEAVRAHMEKVEMYFQTVVFANGKYDDIRDQW